MANPVLKRNTAALQGTGATVQGIALITLLYPDYYRQTLRLIVSLFELRKDCINI